MAGHPLTFAPTGFGCAAKRSDAVEASASGGDVAGPLTKYAIHQMATGYGPVW